jgi:hypothetical protein
MGNLEIIPDVVQSVAALVGLIVANKGLNAWKFQKTGLRKIEVAEQSLIACIELESLIYRVANPVTETYNLGDLEEKFLQTVSTELRQRSTYSARRLAYFRMHHEEFNALFGNMKLALVYFGDEGEKIFKEFQDVYFDLDVAFSILFRVNAELHCDYPKDFLEEMQNKTWIGSNKKHELRKRVESAVKNARNLFGTEISKVHTVKNWWKL